jgi:hypothetical protein
MDGETASLQLLLSEAAADVRQPLSAEEADQLLASPRPVWRLRLDGTLTRANLLALWIWGAPLHGQDVVVDDFRGRTVFDVFALNAESGRLPIDVNRTFWIAKFRVESFVLGEHPALRRLRASHPTLREYYAIASTRALGDADNWTYVLVLGPPSGMIDPRRVVRFRTSISVVRDATGTPVGYLGDYEPLGQTDGLIQEMHRKLHASGQAYVANLSAAAGHSSMEELRPSGTPDLRNESEAPLPSKRSREETKALRRAFLGGFGSIIDLSGTALAPPRYHVGRALEVDDPVLVEAERHLDELDRLVEDELCALDVGGADAGKPPSDPR